MFYELDLKDQAKKDIVELSEYIFRFSFNESISKKVYDEIYEKIFSLNFMPHKYQEILGNYIAALVKKSYRIFYRIEEETKTVVIVRVIRTDQNLDDIF